MRLLPVALLCAALSPAPASAGRLPATVTPEHYDIAFTVDLNRERFSGVETINVRLAEATQRVVLNSLDLELRDITIRAGGVTQTASVSFDRSQETATLTVPRRVAAGRAEVHLRFAGELSTRLRGLYLSRTARRKYAVTQFESTDARRAFPCFDEPSLKATFSVSATVDRSDTVISNGALVSDTPGPGRAQHTVAFAESPKMSSYLVALAVGDFQCIAAAQDGVPIRVCASPENAGLGQIALDSARFMLQFYDRYFDIKYPFGKLDLVAVPDFAAGAMENTAAIFFRETDLLADSRTASTAARQNVAVTVAHEMAHMWFGDLVTMAWWDDLWLNEGFATWMSSHPLAAWKPEWRVDVTEAADNQQALALDSLKSTRPIHAPVESPAEIEGSFDVIAYEKGAAVLRMVERYVGEDGFRRAINRYLKAHAYGTATSEDLWSAVTADSGRAVDRIIPTFIEQPGAPLVEVSSIACNAQKTETFATFRQSRFSIDRSRAPDDRLWQIPISYIVAGPRTASSPPGTFLLSERSQRVMVAHGCTPWVFANAGGSGYYRTAYPREMLDAFAPDVITVLTPAERLSLIEDEWALVQGGRHRAADYLTIAAGFAGEQASGVLARVASHYDFLVQYLTTDSARPRLKGMVGAGLRPGFDALGIDGATGEPDDRRALRGILVSALGNTADDPDVVASARTAIDRALRGGAPLEPSAASAIVAVAAAHGDRVLYDALAAAADRAASPEERERYLNALPAFRDPVLIQRALAETRSRVRGQDTSRYLARFFENPAARERAWSFIKESWPELEPKVRIAFGEGRIMRAVGTFCDAGSRDDVRRFFAAHPMPTAARALEEALERVDACIALRAGQTASVTEWLERRQGDR